MADINVFLVTGFYNKQGCERAVWWVVKASLVIENEHAKRGRFCFFDAAAPCCLH